jgi:hypothetical protein
VTTSSKRLLYWAPRVSAVLLAAFLALFALDVFGEGLGPWRTLIALAMHLVPTWMVVLVLTLSWRREWIGAIAFPTLGALYAAWCWGEPFAVSGIALISGPALLVGVLFLFNWIHRADLRPATRP